MEEKKIAIFFAFLQKIFLGEQKSLRIDLKNEEEKNMLLTERIGEMITETESLKRRLDIKNRKLSANALYQYEKNRQIEDIASMLSARQNLASDKKIAAHLLFFKRNARADREWQAFIKHFEEVDNGLINRLKVYHPQLTDNEIRFISYTYMKLTIKEIAAITNISVIACKKKKERIVKKLRIPREVDLLTYILKI